MRGVQAPLSEGRGGNSLESNRLEIRTLLPNREGHILHAVVQMKHSNVSEAQNSTICLFIYFHCDGSGFAWKQLH